MGKRTKAYRLLDSKARRYFAKQSEKWNPEKQWRWPSICYTLEHKLAYLEREHYLIGRYSLRGLFHDWKKPFMYLCLWLSEKEIQLKHRNNSPHHLEGGKFKTVPHLIEMYVDWECAALTKPDKPLNSFDTLVHFYPEYIKYVLPVCLVLNPDAIRSDIYIHSWHKLFVDKKHNAKVYADVLDVLRRISLVNYDKDWIPSVKTVYGIYGDIKELEPEKIFALVLMWHSKQLGFEIDFSRVNKLTKTIYCKMRKHCSFTNSGVSVLHHDCKCVKESVYKK